MTHHADSRLRLAQQRRAITLDLFTRYGPVWDEIDSLREAWGIVPSVQLPPGTPPYHILPHPALPRVPGRVHLPPSPATLRALDGLHTIAVPDSNPSGTDALGWIDWMAFLSACVRFDPPPLSLLAFAAHDNEAPQRRVQTYFEDAGARAQAEVDFSHDMVRTEFASPPDPACTERITEADEQFLDILWRYHQQRRSSYKPSMMPSSPPRPRGRPPIDELTAVQCAIWKRHGWTHHAIAAEMGWTEHPDSTDPRHRKNVSEDHVRRGEEILRSRKYSD